MIFPGRRRGRAGPFLTLRLGSFFGGAVLALLGIGMEIPWLVTAAILVLLVGVALGLYPREEEPGEDQGSP